MGDEMKRTYSVWVHTVSGKWMQKWDGGRPFYSRQSARQAAIRRGLIAFRVLRDIGQLDFAQGPPAELK